MTISSSISKISYEGNGSNKTFDIPFYIQSADDITLTVLNEATLEETVLIDNYLITPTSSGYPTVSASLTYPVGGEALATGYRMVIMREVDFLQERSFKQNSDLQPKVVEQALDDLTMQTQQTQEQLDRCVKVPATSTEDPNAFAERIFAGAEDIDTQTALAVASAVTATEQSAIANERANNAETYATQALASKNSAELSETNASASEASALSYKNSASTSASNAGISETNAGASAVTAAEQAVISSSKASEANTSAVNALASETASALSETQAGTYASNANISAGQASTFADNASSFATQAGTYASNASSSATAASNSATSASGSATTATEQAVIATTQANLATASNIYRIPLVHGAGLFNFSITGGTAVAWKLANGTISYSTAPSVTLSAGTSYLYCNNLWANGVQVIGNNTGANFLGNLSSFSNLTYYLSLYTCANVTGNLSSLSNLTYYLNLYSCTQITGNLSSLSNLTYYLDLYACTQITGNLSSLSNLTYYLDLLNCSLITGSLSSLSNLTNYLRIYGCTQVTGVLTPKATLYYVDISKTSISSSDLDTSIINLNAITTVTNGTLRMSGLTRSSASTSAVNALITKGWSVTDATVVG